MDNKSNKNLAAESPLYVVESSEMAGALANVTIRMNAAHSIYRAHFPGQPITPGAVLIAIAIDVVSSQLGQKRDADEVRNVKFLHPHNPTEQEQLTFTFDATQSPVEVAVAANGTLYAKMSLVF